jgi:hypothetical protein
MAGLMTIFAIALELAKPIAVSSAFTAFCTWAIMRGLALSLLAAGAICYSLTAELSLVAASRGDLTAKREAAIEGHADKREAIKAARTELATMAPSRTVEEAKADITKLLAANPKAGDCRNPTANATARYTCPKVAVLNGEVARAKRRAELQAVIAKATDRPETEAAAHVKAADPASAALATYLGSLGFEVSATKLTDWLVVIPVLALEIGAALSAVLVQSVSGGQRPGPSLPASSKSPPQGEAAGRARESVDRQTPAPAGEAKEARTVHAGPKSRSRRTSTRTATDGSAKRRLGPVTTMTRADAAGRIVDTLKQRGGRLHGVSVRGLASLVGARKSTAHNAIAALIAAGTVARIGTELVLTA